MYVYRIKPKGGGPDAQNKHLHHGTSDEETEGHIEEDGIKNVGDHSRDDRRRFEKI